MLSNDDLKLLKLVAEAVNYKYDGINKEVWNPLTNDGDALRLVVAWLPFYEIKYTREDLDYCNGDPYAAARRAIVKAVIIEHFGTL